MKRFHKMMNIIEYFVTRKWYFTNNKFVKMNDDLIGPDKETFYCDVRTIDFVGSAKAGYFISRKIFLKETDEDVVKAQIRMK